MDIRQLEYFVAVVKYGSITKAADALFVSQPTISIALRRLETEVGVPLFDRKQHVLQLTEAGNAFLKGAAAALNDIDNARNEAVSIFKKTKSCITIALAQPFGDTSTKLLHKLAKLNYTFKFFATSYTPASQLKNMLMNDQIDICLYSPAITGEQLTSEIIWKRKLYAFVSREHRLAGRDTVKLLELADEVFSAAPRGSGTRELFEKYCEQAGFKPKVEYENSVAGDAIAAAESKLCISVGYISANSKHIADASVVPLAISDPECYTTLGITWKKGREHDPAFRNVLDVICAELNE